jgi:uncharacterized membrane protein YcgQ (UPF0703/DUF1980 family)
VPGAQGVTNQNYEKKKKSKKKSKKKNQKKKKKKKKKKARSQENWSNINIKAVIARD